LVLPYSAQPLVYCQHYCQSSSLWWRCGGPYHLTFSLRTEKRRHI